MVKKIGDKKKIKGVDSAKEADEIKKAESVGEVKKVKKTEAVKGAGAVGRAGGTSLDGSISKSNKDHLLQLVDEELEKLISSGAIPEKQREVVKSAIEMTLEGALIDEDEN